MKSRTVKLALFSVVFGTLGGWAWTQHWAEAQQRRLIAEQNARLEAREQHWASEAAARQVAAHEQALAVRHRREREMAAALGDPAKVPTCNPDLDLRQRLEQAALLCAPAGAKATVKVERSTEFDVLVELPERLDTHQMADVCRCLLRGHAAYVQSVRFVPIRTVLAELDRRAIKSIPDWTVATTAVVAPLLFGPEAEATAPRPKPSPAAVTDREELTGDQKRLADFHQAYDYVWQTNYAKFTNVIWVLEVSVRLANVTAPNQLDARLKTLDAAEHWLQDASAFFAQQSTTYDRVLAEAGFDELVVRILKRSQAELDAQEQPHFTRLFTAAQDSLQQTRALLLEMKQNWGAWKPAPGGRELTFTSQAVADAYRRAGGQVKHSQNELAAALKAWADWLTRQSRQ